MAPTATPSVSVPGEALTLRAVIARAIAANRDLRTARSALLQARMGQSIADSTVFAPTLSAAYTAYNGEGDNGTGRIALTSKALGFEIEPYVRMGYIPDGRVPTDPVGLPDSYGTAAGLTISRKLFAISEHINQRLPISEADAATYAAANRLVLAGRELERRATEQFLAVQRADTRLAVRERRLRDAREFLDSVRDRITHGFASPLDGLYAEIDLNQAEADLIADRTAQASAMEQLDNLLDRPVTAPLTLAPEVIDDARVAAIPTPDLDRDTKAVLAGHESLGTAAKQAELLALQLRVQRDRLWPDLTAALSAERGATGDAPFDARDSLGNTVALTVTWTMPLDGWRADRARFNQICKQIEDQERSAASLRADLEIRLRDAWRQIDAQRRQVALSTRRLEIERLRLDATLRRYETGAVDNLEVTRAKQSLDNAEIAVLDARIALVLADAQYRALLPMTPTPVAAEAPEAGAHREGP
jgi:outer membrane protein TolC